MRRTRMLKVSVDTAEELVAALRPLSALWSRPSTPKLPNDFSFPNWWYRGHGDEQWELVGTAFRDTSVSADASGLAEFARLANFCRRAVETGLPIPVSARDFFWAAAGGDATAPLAHRG